MAVTVGVRVRPASHTAQKFCASAHCLLVRVGVPSDFCLFVRVVFRRFLLVQRVGIVASFSLGAIRGVGDPRAAVVRLQTGTGPRPEIPVVRVSVALSPGRVALAPLGQIGQIKGARRLTVRLQHTARLTALTCTVLPQRQLDGVERDRLKPPVQITRVEKRTATVVVTDAAPPRLKRYRQTAKSPTAYLRKKERLTTVVKRPAPQKQRPDRLIALSLSCTVSPPEPLTAHRQKAPLKTVPQRAVKPTAVVCGVVAVRRPFARRQVGVAVDGGRVGVSETFVAVHKPVPPVVARLAELVLGRPAARLANLLAREARPPYRQIGVRLNRPSDFFPLGNTPFGRLLPPFFSRLPPL